ncbi:MAG: hypothetical protein CMP51_01435 [Flavobacteriales bacterium]|nr:hypothetical protein [Flavobacteriales bacterium]
MKLYNYLLVVICIVNINLFSQNNFYNIDSVKEIKMEFYESNWDYILDSLYVLGQKDRVLADVIIDGIRYDSAGVRYKGFSSVSINRIKNPFNIKLDYIKEDQNHLGIKKLKLSNVIQDPSFIREVLSYEICRKYLPSSQANFANLYIHDTLWGLYTNVEAVNKSFLSKHYGEKYNPFFKCNPDHLNIQIGGENSNLSNTHGTDSSDYYSYYDMESNYGWESLYELIDTLNMLGGLFLNTDEIINRDRTLWMHALNYSMINFDSYIGYGQNYYLYKDQSNQWNPIIWDLNMSFGSFRLTDASQLYFNGFNINQAQNMDPLTHLKYISISPRPLITNMFTSPMYMRMYLAHIRTIIKENFINQDYFHRGQYIQGIIDQHVQNDTNKFYTYSDFIANLTDQVALPSSMCPGITQLMDARSSYLSSYIYFDTVTNAVTAYSGEPTISNITHLPQNFSNGDDLYILADISNASHSNVFNSSVKVFYRFGKNQRYRSVNMYDDGNNYDGLANDGVYGSKIENVSNSIDFYLYAENDTAGIFSPERASYEYYTIKTNVDYKDLVINEIMSNNESYLTDNSGKYEDWIEIYNSKSYPISLDALYLSDTISDPLKFSLPNYVLLPNRYCVIWADNDGHQGDDHANFQLSNLGEVLILSNSDSSIVDSINFISQPENLAYARVPNGTGSFVLQQPTFKANNDITSDHELNYEQISVFPNPFDRFLKIFSDCSYNVSDLYGKLIINKSNNNIINTSGWSSGIYFINLDCEELQKVKVIKVN